MKDIHIWKFDHDKAFTISFCDCLWFVFFFTLPAWSECLSAENRVERWVIKFALSIVTDEYSSPRVYECHRANDQGKVWQRVSNKETGSGVASYAGDKVEANDGERQGFYYDLGQNPFKANISGERKRVKVPTIVCEHCKSEIIHQRRQSNFNCKCLRNT